MQLRDGTHRPKEKYAMPEEGALRGYTRIMGSKRFKFGKSTIKDDDMQGVQHTRDRAQAQRVLISNLDSTEQLDAWKRLCQEQSVLDAVNDVPNLDPSFDAKIRTYINTLWHSDNNSNGNSYTDNGNKEKSERDSNGFHINADNFFQKYPIFVQYLAGVLRTGYLYSPKIVLTVPMVCDGIFLMLLGPEIVLNLLGRSYKDGTRIIISGSEDSLMKQIEKFYIQESADGGQCIIAPKEYCIFDTSLTQEDCKSLCFGMPHNDEPVRAHTQTIANNPTYVHASHAVSECTSFEKLYTIAKYLSALIEQKTHMRIDPNMLAQRWNAWVDAEQHGLIEYRKQINKFSDCFNDNVTTLSELIPTNTEQLLKQASTHQNEQYAFQNYINVSSVDLEKYKELLTKLRGLIRRSEAFEEIRSCDLLKQDLEANRRNLVQEQKAKSLLRDWYQVVYMKTMANVADAELIVVGSSKNIFAQITARQQEQQSVLSLNGEITDKLGEMPYMYFGQFCYKARTAIEQWRTCTSNQSAKEKRRCTRKIVYAVSQATQEIDIQQDKKDMCIQTAIAAIIAVISVLIDQFANSENTIPIIAVIAVMWLISMIPEVLPILRWGMQVHSAEKTVVYLG